MASAPRCWPALIVRSAEVDATGELAGLVTLALDGCAPLAIEELTPLPLPPGGLWDPTVPPPPEPPPTPLWWRLCFTDDGDRRRATSAIAALDRGLELETEELPDDDWVARSQQALTHVAAGRFVIAPPWDVPPALPADRRLVVIEPSMGFGTGHHATTRLCLRALDALDLTGLSVLDIGSGSGVLALAASLAGARSVEGIDTDEDAVAAAGRSALLNPSANVRFRTGDIASAGPAADVVLANLTGAMLTRSVGHLGRWVAAGGHLIVSGFLHDERGEVERAFTGPFVVDARLDEDGWCALTLKREG